MLSQDDEDDQDDESGESDSSNGLVSRQGLLSPVLPKTNANEASIWIANLQGLDQQQPHESTLGETFEHRGQRPVMYSP